ncbi:MAG: YIP1 family protein [Acidobacteriota bacterium]
MTDSVAQPIVAPAPSGGLLARAVGVIFSPKTTYATVAALPRVLGAFFLILVISCAGTIALLSTEVGQQAALEQQIQQRRAFGAPPMTEEQSAQIERLLPYFGYIGAAYVAVALVVFSFALSGLMFAIFNALLGGDATFKQVLAIVVHSGFVFSLSSFFTLPLNYIRESLSSTTNLGVFVPFLEETSLVARLLGALDLVVIWWMLNLAIGLGVLYKRRTGPVAVGLLVTYFVIALVIAVVRSAFWGS